MIIDSHTHILDRSWLPEKWWLWLENEIQKKAFFRALKREKASRIEKYLDPDGEKLLASMDQAGIDISIVLPLDLGLLLGEPETSIEEQNHKIAVLCQKNPERLIGFVGVDPRRPNAEEIIKIGIKDWKLRGVKLHPGTGFRLGGKASLRLFEVISDLNVPVVVHTGQASGPMLSKYCRPIELDKIAVLFPSLKIIAAHLGCGWIEEMLWTGRANDGIYSDISSLQFITQKRKDEFDSVLREAVDMFGRQRILFGSDWPFFESILRVDKYLALIKNLSQTGQGKEAFRKSEIRAILGKNTARCLNVNVI
ncbi:MAG: amidohydrolase family protein [Cytophagales bacterium]|nr:amidohydrolase family protein [Cytophagales bacterium]